MSPRKLVILGLSITSSWGNGHATTYRALVRELVQRGHQVIFLERDMPWYRDTRDLPSPPYGRTHLYENLEELFDTYQGIIEDADLVIIGSYVPDGIKVGHWVLAHARGIVAFYDIDTPVTLTALAQGRAEYISPDLIRRYDLYLSFTGGPTLQRLEHEFEAQRARALYCSVDPEAYYPQVVEASWDLGYLGTYAPDRQPMLECLLNAPARAWFEGRFVVAGPSYPTTVQWPSNVERIEHLPPSEHGSFYNRQRFTLNITRADMAQSGYAPSVRLFEAAACGIPIISDGWSGIDEFFHPGTEILLASSAKEVVSFLQTMPEEHRCALGEQARRRVLADHTAAQRVKELESYIEECFAGLGAETH
ncbi:CgeB family protein [Nitrosococcus wardiae]|uniref:Glycosyltransferase n=1 Tax=Nitrosococcus wardiae TaxID=1814290 RepID=A0A4P7BZR2_9GAMM|nr:glycosyltransferase [Nitrosococcus wardiae]QBQ55738.1 glycosyltransferase [Nitrosococcus wardiae]